MKKLTGSALLMTILLASPLMAYSAPTSNKTQTEAEIKVIEHDIQQMNKLLGSLNEQRTSVQTRIQKSDQELVQLQKDILSLEAKLKEGQGDVKKLQRRQNSLAVDIDQQKKQIARSIKSMYLTSNDSRLKLLLNQEDPEEISRQLTYLDYVQKAQLGVIRKFETSIKELNEVERQKQTLLTQLSTEKVTLDKKKASLQKRQAERKKMLASLNKKRSNNSHELIKMQQQREKLKDVLASIQSRIIVGSAPFTALKGQLPRPFSGKVLYGYNRQRPDTRLSWPGIFMSGQSGQPVRVVHDGRIIFSDWMRGYGLLTIVDHGEDYLTLYGHTQEVMKKEGDVVLAGEVLATSGQSGGQLNSGVYFEIRKKGNPVNPEKWLRKN